MAISAVRNWFGRPERSPAHRPFPPPEIDVVPASAGDEPLADPGRPGLLWSADRLAVTDVLWGEGYQFPGGEVETLHLAKPLGLTAAASLLLLGAGGGGAAGSLATKFGVWVSAFEADPTLSAAATDLITRKNLTRRAQVEAWNPGDPAFREHFYHHGLALEPLRGSTPEPVLAGIATALKPSGQLMMTELVADAPLDPANPVVAAWAKLEQRDPEAVPTEVSITRILGRLGFDVHVAEDVSQRHVHQTLMGWRTAVRMMENVRPSRREAMRYVQEAELWLLRLRLCHLGSLRLVRWHAIRGGG